METTDTISSTGSSSSPASNEAATISTDEQVVLPEQELDDATLIEQAEAMQKVERLLVAAKLLQQVKDKSLLTDQHKYWIKWANMTEKGMRDLLQSPDAEGSKWIKQSESHGHRDFLVYYQVNEKNQLSCRIESAIEESMVEPIIAVFNESDLYETWMPSWKKPIKMGVQKTKMLKELGRGNQIIQVRVDMAWPLKARESVQHAVATDVIEEENAIAVQVLTEDHEDDPDIPPPEKGVNRIEFECSILIRACPPDHPCLAKSKVKYPEGQSIILFSLKCLVDAHVKIVPMSLINFVSRTVMGRMWAALLQVAEDIRDGNENRQQHVDAIANKRELYDWIQSRVEVMLKKVKENEKELEQQQN